MSKTMTLDAIIHDQASNLGARIAEQADRMGVHFNVIPIDTSAHIEVTGEDIMPFGTEDDEEDDCIHEDYEIDILTGRATCDGCGETWTATDAQMQRHEELSQQGYDPIGEAVDCARDRDEERRATGEDDE